MTAPLSLYGLDRTGQVYGPWEALNPTGRRDASGGVFWCVRSTCCGRVRTMNGKNLAEARREGTRTCSRCRPRPTNGHRVGRRGSAERSVGTPEHEERVRRYTEAVDRLRARGLLGAP